MLLEIVNFRCWKKKTFSIQDKGLFLLSGSSGVGKSSILNAIYFCMYGIGTKVITNGEKKCSVRLVHKDFDMTRTKNPNRLVLTYQGMDYEDEVAQELIDKRYGKHFTITSYITQKMVYSFLNMSPSEKMSLLETIVLGDENIGGIKRRSKEVIRQKREQLVQKSGQVEVIEREFLSMENPEAVPFPLGEKHSDIKIKNESIYWKRTQKMVREKEQEKQDVEKQFNLEKIKQTIVSKNNSVLLETECKLNQLYQEKECIRYDGDDNLEALEETLRELKYRKEFEILKEKYQKDEKQFLTLVDDEMKKLQVELDEIKQIDSDSDFDDIRKTIDFIDTEIKKREKIHRLTQEIERERKVVDTFEETTKYELQISEKNKERDVLKTEKRDMENRIDIKVCPSCNCSLKIKNNDLIVAEGDPIDVRVAKKDIDEYTKKIKIADTEIHTLQQKISDRKKYESILKKLESELHESELYKDDEYSDFSIAQLKNRYNENHLLVQEKKKLQEKIKLLTQKINNKELSPTLKSIQQQLLKDKKKLQSFSLEEIETDYTEDELQQEISVQKVELQKYKNVESQISRYALQHDKLKKEIDDIHLLDRDFETELEQIRTEITDLYKKEKLHQQKNIEIQRYLEFYRKNEEYKKWNQKVQTLKSEEKKLQYELNMSETFYKKIIEAESISIAQSIDEINYYMNVYLDKFFPVHPITVQISPYKETKKDMKPMINIEVGYKGVEMDINSLSGGEYDRVALSIVLSLNTLFGNDILMLDESISSLDSELTNDILEILKENLQEKLVIVVAHQINEGVFDEVYEIQN